MSTPISILFTGYAPVHFVCFRPLYEHLVRMPEVEMFLSGGLKVKGDSETHYDTDALYAPFGFPPERILSVEEIRRRDFDVLFSAHTGLILPRNVKTRIQIFHGISFRNKAVRPENMGCDYYFVVGPHMHRKFVDLGLFAEEDPRGWKVGFPKTDRLINGTLDRDAILRQYGLDGRRPIVVYAPAGAKKNSMEVMGEEIVQSLSASGEFDLLVKPHDHPKKADVDYFQRLARFENGNTRVVRDYDVIPLLYIADVLLTDVSSVASEYTLLDRPILFLDVPKLLKKERKKSKSLDLDGRRGGRVVKRGADLLEAVRESLKHPECDSPLRRTMARQLMYNPGCATDVAMQHIRAHLGISQPGGVVNLGA